MAKKAARWDTMDKSNAPLEKLILQFQAFSRSEGKTRKTILWYDTSLRLFGDYLKKINVNPVLGEVTLELVREYVHHLQTRHKFEDHPSTPRQEEMLSPQTIQCYVRGVKAFFNWLYKEGYSAEFVLERLKPPKAPKKLVDPLANTEISAILYAIDAQTSWRARNTAMVVLFLDTGLRLSEFLTLHMPEFHMEDNYVKVMGNCQKERIVPFGSSAPYLFRAMSPPSMSNCSEGLYLPVLLFSGVRSRGLVRPRWSPRQRHHFRPGPVRQR
ncbi:MAG: tyrosine-type recombinase/integrase [SAR202 cluster bacterium]|nr:tyrosine-type recombinase/integrase [SAR202 cluster bacterium]